MVQAPRKRLTLAEFLALPETKPASEFIDPDEESIFVYGSDSSRDLGNNRTVAIFEEPQASLPVPNFASAVQLTVGQVFGWLGD